MTVRGLAVVVAVLMVTGCASVVPKPAAVESEAQIKWRQHHAQVASLDQWDISGRIGVRTADTGGSANLRWKLDNGRDQIDLFGPFGGGRIRLDIDPDGARLRDGVGEEFFAASANQICGLGIAQLISPDSPLLSLLTQAVKDGNTTA